MMNITAAVLLGALTFCLTNLVKSIRGKEWNAVVTQLLAFLVGLGVVFLGSAAKVTSSYVFNGHPLNDLDTWSKFYVGLLATGLFGVVDATHAAFDGTRSSKKPDLVPPPNS